jgi:hypothetical protein
MAGLLSDQKNQCRRPCSENCDDVESPDRRIPSLSKNIFSQRRKREIGEDLPSDVVALQSVIGLSRLFRIKSNIDGLIVHVPGHKLHNGTQSALMSARWNCGLANMIQSQVGLRETKVVSVLNSGEHQSLKIVAAERVIVTIGNCTVTDGFQQYFR